MSAIEGVLLGNRMFDMNWKKGVLLLLLLWRLKIEREKDGEIGI